MFITDAVKRSPEEKVGVLLAETTKQAVKITHLRVDNNKMLDSR